ncbi:MAG: hypothetical protein M3H12_18765 [Chromatiales bacterium]|nr:hypothetical protein [Gammaproteobacteria bacterium]
MLNGYHTALLLIVVIAAAVMFSDWLDYQATIRRLDLQVVRELQETARLKSLVDCIRPHSQLPDSAASEAI